MTASADAHGRRPGLRGGALPCSRLTGCGFEKLHRHGPLPSSFLLAYSAGLRQSGKRATERLTDLFHEDRTRHGGRYLDRPLQQFRTLDSRYNQLVYDLAPAGQRALSEAGMLVDGVSARSGPWLHRFMVSCATASIELACLRRADVTYISQRAILARADTELRYPVTIPEPGAGGRITKDLIPDALFGLEHHTPDGSRFRFFAVECDRATEPATTTNFNRKSWRRNLVQYQVYVGAGAYRRHLNLTAPLLVLNITTSQQRLEKMIAVTEAEQGNCPYHCLRSWPDFGPVFRPPSPAYELLDDLWRRAGHDDFCIGTV